MADIRSGLDPKDYKYLKKDADPGFSPERNKAVIDETLKDADNLWKLEMEAYRKLVGNKIDILTSYGIYRFNKGTKDLKGYLGDKVYNQVLGEKILSKIRILESGNKLSPRGNKKGLV